MTSSNDFLLILGALEVGLKGAVHPDPIKYEMPPIHPDFPPVAARAIVSIGGTSYRVVISEAEVEPECSKSTHGNHTPVNGVCIGCGEKVS